ncbi:hypothetical protein SAMN03159444_04813 [Pseudomonas sp. NFACC02]|nr:hypothetical protein SAMN03159444_04813 [Pseudomonas sp. NFACC02]
MKNPASAGFFYGRCLGLGYGHPCPDGGLAASMPLDPLRVICVWPGPKSRFVVSRRSLYEDQRQRHRQSYQADAVPVGAWLVPRSAGNRQRNLHMQGVRQNRVVWFCYRCAADRGTSHAPTAESAAWATGTVDRSHAPRGNAATDALRQRGRGASWQAFPRGAWERSCKPKNLSATAHTACSCKSSSGISKQASKR